MITLHAQSEPQVLISKEYAEEIVSKLTADEEDFDDGWSYKAEPRGEYFTVVAYDEEGNRMGCIH